VERFALVVESHSESVYEKHFSRSGRLNVIPAVKVNKQRKRSQNKEKSTTKGEWRSKKGKKKGPIVIN
jgi:hypothetical protein